MLSTDPVYHFCWSPTPGAFYRFDHHHPLAFFLSLSASRPIHPQFSPSLPALIHRMQSRRGCQVCWSMCRQYNSKKRVLVRYLVPLSHRLNMLDCLLCCSACKLDIARMVDWVYQQWLPIQVVNLFWQPLFPYWPGTADKSTCPLEGKLLKNRPEDKSLPFILPWVAFCSSTSTISTFRKPELCTH